MTRVVSSLFVALLVAACTADWPKPKDPAVAKAEKEAAWAALPQELRDLEIGGAEIFGLGLSVASAGRPAKFTIVPKDPEGNNISIPGLGRLFVVVVEPPSLHGGVQEHPDGSLEVVLVHEWEMNATVTVKLLKDDRNLGDSPYTVQVIHHYKVIPASDVEPLPHVSANLPQLASDDRLAGVRGAFATIVVSDPFVFGAVVLMHTLRKSGARFPLVALVTDTLSTNGRRVLEQHGVLVKHVESIKNPKPKLDEPAWENVYTKLRAWQLIEYDKVVFMDADQIVLKNIDHLLLEPAFSAVPDLAPPTVFNSGLMVLEPSEATFQEMMESIKVMKSYDEGDQGFLNEFFWGRWHMLPFTYNYLKSKTGNPDAFYWFLNLQRWSIHVIHMVGVKTWKCTPERDCGLGFMERNVPEMWNLWWREFDEACSEGHLLCMDPLAPEPSEEEGY